MAGLYAPLPTLRRHPREWRRTARGRCGSLLLHRSGLAPPTPCRSPGALRCWSNRRHAIARQRNVALCQSRPRTCASVQGLFQSRVLLSRFWLRRMRACPLRQQNYAPDDESRDDRRSKGAAQVEATMIDGLSRKSPTVAPSGRVRMNAAQNSVTREILVQ